ncbi:TIGR01777 family oxidoreductase [Acinetobacter gerneri]|uniref:TIGR01777 family protein n=1 Tax=Acinetobacter gerneri DSM 14967 = CIP 107464 = MTCC 9824 TaxID=1120926 RepID=N8ZIV0_9GAMM|nr:TIGR01777 family oxidoreductase [Acinetobacter gerneri]ENV33679.1 TIGR01777 family protein [Acinetobacter gerneri DSM 14967 = CIP 107464 = MTCC 9824]EPR82180.1 Cell division inhibitor [Acinetobacter gerneri DSM 14967 = CIP 107464 = MTCC 9824]
MYKATVLMTGASGFIGKHLIEYFTQQQYLVIGLSRKTNKVSPKNNLIWVNDFSEIQTTQIDYVINLAGENIGNGRWTDFRKDLLIYSRVNLTLALYQWLEKHGIRPKCIISGSAIGYYGIDPSERWNAVLDETAPAQDIFMSELCQKWESTALNFFEQNTKIIRLGVVFAKQGGALAKMLLPIKFNLFKKIATGHQPIVWVHIEDVIRCIEFLFNHHSTQKIYNLVAPEMIMQKQFAEAAANILGKKPLFNCPKKWLKLLLGEQSQLILNGQYVIPKMLIQEGFQFKHYVLEHALEQLLDS